MKLSAMVMGASALVSLGACASAPPPDLGALLMAPCANPADDMPWLVVVNWEGGDVYRQLTRFSAKGELFYAYEKEPDDVDKERWSISGDTLVFDMNNHFADYTGVFDGAAGKGAVTNVKRERGDWTLTRDCRG